MNLSVQSILDMFLPVCLWISSISFYLIMEKKKKQALTY